MNNNYENLPAVLNANQLAAALGISRAGAYQLLKQFGKIQIMAMPELMETRFRVRPAVIDGLLTAGTYLLAGAPKIGKSFLVLQMAYQVSMGAPFLGFSSRQGTVLYLALEDTCERLQKRLAQMTEQDSEHLILSVFSETLDEGLTERLSDFWSEHTDTVLIIIDTLQRVRGRTPDNGSYAADYDTLARLKEFSDTYGVTVLVVHHTRKEGAEDVFNMFSGTNGLMGAADGALLDHKAVCAGYGRAYEMLCKAAGILSAVLRVLPEQICRLIDVIHRLRLQIRQPEYTAAKQSHGQ